jgi:hypothetical protein
MAQVHYKQALSQWDGKLDFTYEKLTLAALMAIRDELRSLNNVMQCSNVSKGFRALAKIAARDEKAFKRRVEHAVAKRVKRSR